MQTLVRVLVLATLATSLPADLLAGGRAKTGVQDTLVPLAPQAVVLQGHLAERLDCCIENRIKAQSISDVVNPFIKREEVKFWRTEFWGKWFTSAALAYRYSGDTELAAILDTASRQLIATQTPDGYIGTYKKDKELEQWDIWGRKYVLLGLMAEYDRTGSEQVLTAACRELDYLMTQVGPGKKDIVKLGRWTGMAASSILEPTVLLYRATNRQEYLDFAEYIVAQWDQPHGPQLVDKALNEIPVLEMFPGPKKIKKSYRDYGESKAYEMMSCYEGLLELYRVTGKEEYRQAVENLFEDVLKTEIVLVGSGSNKERWCGGKEQQDVPMEAWMETCVTTTWMKLCTQLFRLTGDPKYFDEIERSGLNALLGALENEGTWWCHYMPLTGVRGPAPEQCLMHMNCCVANGPRSLALLPMLAVMSNERGPVVNLYEQGRAQADLPSGRQVLIEQRTDYPQSGKIELIVSPVQSERFTLSLRIPAWSQTNKLSVNGEPLATEPGTYARIQRKWKTGDRVELELDMRVRVVEQPGKGTELAVVRGPLVLALDKRLATPASGGKPVMAKPQAGSVSTVSAAQLPPNVWMAFDIPFQTKDGKTIKMRMCDFASAGQTWSADSRYRVWLPQQLDLRQPFAGISTEAYGH